MEEIWRQIDAVATPLLAYTLAAALGGSGFIAAFTAGIMFRLVDTDHAQEATFLAEQSGELLNAVTFLLSGAVVADHIRIGMGCEGSARCQSAISLTDQQLWPWSISYGSNRAGRIGVTEHITGPSASECCTRARGRQRGHVDLAWLLLGRSVGARP